MTSIAVYQLFVLLLAANAAAAVAWHAWKRRPAPGVTGFSLCMALLALWSLASSFEQVSVSAAAKFFWAKAQFVAVAFLPLTWLGFALRYAGADRATTRRIVGVLALQPLLSVLLLVTNPMHRWVWGGTALDINGLLPRLVLVRGPWLQFHIVFASVLLLAASLALLRPLVQESSVGPERALGLLFSASAPWVGYFLLVLAPVLPISMDLAPFVCTLTGLVVAWELLHLHSLALVPSAHNAAVKDMHDALIVLDARLCVVDLNAAAEEIAGAPTAAVIGCRGENLFPGNELMAELISHPTNVQCEVLLEWNGVDHKCEVQVSPLRGHRQAHQGRTVSIRDITPLATAEERYSNLFKQSKDALLIHDASGDIIDANQTALELFDYSRSEILLLGVTALYPQGAQEKWERARSKAHSEGYAEFELDFRRKDGSTFPAEVSLSLIKIAGDHIVQVLVRDITERKRVQEEWRRAKEAAEAASFAKTRFLANMSHEIRTPMNAIIGMTELLLATELDRKQRKFLTTVESSADALMSLLNDILDASKIEAGRLDLEPMEFDLRDLLNDCVNVLAVRAQQKGLALTCEVDEDVPDRVVTDPGRLRQIVLNLVGNGIKFTDRGEVRISVAVEQGTDDFVRLHFRISDTGIGIPPNKIEMIFDPFMQADNSTTREYGGTGLGLTIVSQLIDLMNGRVWVESEVDEGSVFHFVAEFSLHAPRVDGATTRIEDLKRLKALIVDDNAANRLLYDEALQSFGMRTQCADGAAVGLEMLLDASRAGEPFHLVILDANMPGIDGFGLARRLRDEDEIQQPVLMMLTSGGERGDAARCRELGINAYLRKPIGSAALRDGILMTLAAPTDSSGRSVLITRHSMREAQRPLHVLLADDNPVNQDMAMFMLESAGHRVQVVDNGKAAVEAVRGDHDFDVILMDAEMPEMDGLEATRTIRRLEQENGHRVPIVAMTAHAMKGDRQRCLRAGMDAYLSKPVRTEQLLQTIANVVAGEKAMTLEEDDDALAPEEPREDAVMDLDAALRMTKGRKNLLARVANVFLSDYPQVIDGLRASIADGDLEAVRLAAHRLKGSLGTFMAGRARQSALSLEECAARGDGDEAMRLLPSLEKELESLRPELETLSGGAEEATPR